MSLEQLTSSINRTLIELENAKSKNEEELDGASIQKSQSLLIKDSFASSRELALIKHQVGNPNSPPDVVFQGIQTLLDERKLETMGKRITDAIEL